MKSNGAALTNWLAKTTLAQRIVLGIGGFLIIGMIGLGIYTLLPKETTSRNIASGQETTVNVKDISTEQTAAVAATPAESKTLEAQTATNDMSTVVESNVTTVETPAIASEPTYTSEETGGRYEAPQDTYTESSYSEPAASTPSYSEPAAETPAASSGGGWNGDFGGTSADSTYIGGGDGSGHGISN